MEVVGPGFRARTEARPRHRLDADKLIETAKHLSADINDRLPGSSLAGLARQLEEIAVVTVQRGQSARQPILLARALSTLGIFAGLALIVVLSSHVHARWSAGTIGEVFETISAGTNLLILLAGGVWTCLTLERQLKRREALAFIEELREFVHVIDVTQLHDTPDLYRSRPGSAPVRMVIDETYLLYCTQMLAVISNLAPLYTRGVTGDSILRAAHEVQMLANAITTKHLAKAEAFLLMGRGRPIDGKPAG